MGCGDILVRLNIRCGVSQAEEGLARAEHVFSDAVLNRRIGCISMCAISGECGHRKWRMRLEF
jgi:hypothetical protein